MRLLCTYVSFALAQTGMAPFVSDDFDRSFSDGMGLDWIERDGEF